MSQNKYMAVSLTETKADTKKAKSVSQNYRGSVDASVEALNREFGIYKRENEIAMDELRTKIRTAAQSGGGSGEAGKDGEDGVGIKSIEQTVTSTESGGENKIEITLTDDKKEEFTVRNGEKGDNGDDGKDGKDGKDGSDGVSCTHSWNGTVLTVTSASGSSSSDLKGDKGDNGDNGKDGTSITITKTTTSSSDGGSNKVTFSDGTVITIKNGSKGSSGSDGKTPVRGTDYWTTNDINTIKTYVEDAILKGEW